MHLSNMNFRCWLSTLVLFLAIQEASIAETSSFTGSGVQNDDYMLNDEELSILESATPYYSPYAQPENTTEIVTDVPYGIIGDDERVRLDEINSFPERAVAQIVFNLPPPMSFYTKNCTGAMISSNLVLTAGHCVFRGKQTDNGFEGRWVKNVLVFPGLNGAVKNYGPCKAKNLFALEGWTNPIDGADRRLSDLGAIELDCNVGNKTGWFGLTKSDHNQEVIINGYPCDATSGRQMASRKDSLYSTTEKNIFYENDTAGCMSGSPIRSKEHLIYGVHTTNYNSKKSEPWKTKNSGVRINDQVLAKVQNWLDRTKIVLE